MTLLGIPRAGCAAGPPRLRLPGAGLLITGGRRAWPTPGSAARRRPRRAWRPAAPGLATEPWTPAPPPGGQVWARPRPGRGRPEALGRPLGARGRAGAAGGGDLAVHRPRGTSWNRGDLAGSRPLAGTFGRSGPGSSLCWLRRPRPGVGAVGAARRGGARAALLRGSPGGAGGSLDGAVCGWRGPGDAGGRGEARCVFRACLRASVGSELGPFSAGGLNG